MDRLLQFMFVLTIVTSSNSYVYKRHEPEVPDTLKYDLDYNYPTEYIESLVDALSPAELQKLRSIIYLHHRAGTPSNSRCPTNSHKSSPHYAPDEFGTIYTIVHSVKLPKMEFDVEYCNYIKSHDCYTEEDDIRPTYANCCVQEKELITMNVLAVPANEMQARKNNNTKIVQKDLYIDSRCECETKPIDMQYLENGTDICT